MLPAAVSAHPTLSAVILGATYALNRFLRWHERCSMIKKAPASHMVELARAFNAPKFVGRGAKQEKTMPPAG